VKKKKKKKKKKKNRGDERRFSKTPTKHTTYLRALQV
jgi:hypothetical protein